MGERREAAVKRKVYVTPTLHTVCTPDALVRAAEALRRGSALPVDRDLMNVDSLLLLLARGMREETDPATVAMFNPGGAS